MRDVSLRLSGILLIILAAYLFLSASLIFTPFKYAIFPLDDSLVSPDDIDKGVSYALWDQRSIDVILLALLLFITSACCASILGFKEEGETS